MNSIIFATTNKGKIAELREKLDKHELSRIAIDAQALDIIEPQADSCEEVALSKARQAYNIVGQPVLVDDSSFHITAMGGFPGVYAKYMIEKLGVKGILEFMEGREDRSAHFEGVLVYIDSSGEEHIFRQEPYAGNITDTIHDITNEAPWSDLHKIFMPHGSNNVLGNMPAYDHQKVSCATPSKYTLFAQWLQRSARTR